MLAFVLGRIGGDTSNVKAFQALGAYRGDRLVGGFLYLNYREIGQSGLHSIDMHCAGDTGWLTRKTLRAFYSYPFLELNCARVIGSIRSDNTPSRDCALRMGCTLDGRIRSGISEDLDQCIYTMTRAECPWL